MSYAEAVRDYYSGQHAVALAGALVASLYLLVALRAWWRRTQSARSFAVTVFVLAGLFMLPANVGYFYVGPQQARIETELAHSRLAFETSERAHLDTMMRGFQCSYTLDGAFALLGLVAMAAGIVRKSGKAISAGLALTLCATTLLTGEVWSKHRALRYRTALLAASGG